MAAENPLPLRLGLPTPDHLLCPNLRRHHLPATPIATTPAQHLPALPQSFFARPAQAVAPELIGCLLLKRQANGELLWGVLVETEAYCQSEPACHGYRRRSPSNETLFGEPGRFYVYVSYGIHHCVNVVTGRAEWANGVLLRALALPQAPPRLAAGPGLLARCFGIDRGDDGRPASPESGLWIARFAGSQPLADAALWRGGRIGISRGGQLAWRWGLAGSPSLSRPF